MSTKDFTANVISASKVVPDGNFKDSKASGIWDINEALDLIKGGNWPNVANVNPSAFVDALFQTHVYDGTGSAQTITNGIDLSSKGGLVWLKSRVGSYNHWLFDTERGAGASLKTNDSDAQNSSLPNSLSSFNSNGFSVVSINGVNNSGEEVVSWTWRKQPKFFDIVTWTGNGTENRAISHNLGSVPGMIIVKGYSLDEDWNVYHRSLGNAKYIQLNGASAAVDVDTGAGGANLWFSTDPTSSVFTIDEHARVNANGESYIAYLFAHNDDDGGFGEPGDQDIIKCGGYTADNAGTEISLGFEPQFIMIKKYNADESWYVYDNMRGVVTGGDDSQDKKLRWNSSGAEAAVPAPIIAFSPNGFITESEDNEINGSNGTYMYMAIRRGGMKTPTAASDVFDVDVNTQAINSSNAPPRTPFVTDMGIYRDRNSDGASTPIFARLQGIGYLQTNSKDTEGNGKTTWDEMDGWGISAASWESSANYIFYNWKRARGYFDVATYTGTGSAGLTVNHNLGVVPEMMWVKSRSHGGNFYDWGVYHKDLGNTKYLFLNTTAAAGTNDEYWNDTSPTSSVFSLGGPSTRTNESGKTYIAHLFATVANVSKVGSFTQSGATNVACGFTGDTPSFILLKRTDATGDWLHYDSARGIVAGNDKSLDLNNTDVEVTADIVDPYSGGFATTSSLANGDYIFYAIASIA